MRLRPAEIIPGLPKPLLLGRSCSGGWASARPGRRFRDPRLPTRRVGRTHRWRIAGLKVYTAPGAGSVGNPVSHFSLYLVRRDSRLMRVAAAAGDLTAARGADARAPARFEHVLTQSRFHHQVADAGCREYEGERVSRHSAGVRAAVRAGAPGSTTRAAADRIRACRARSSTGRRGRASPARCAGRRRLPASGSQTSA